jgi:hypothetical protein
MSLEKNIKGSLKVDSLNINNLSSGILGVDSNGKVIIDTNGVGDKSPWTGGTGSNSAILKESSNIATGTLSVAEGINTQSLGSYSHAEGQGTIAGVYVADVISPIITSGITFGEFKGELWPYISGNYDFKSELGKFEETLNCYQTKGDEWLVTFSGSVGSIEFNVNSVGGSELDGSDYVVFTVEGGWTGSTGYTQIIFQQITSCGIDVRRSHAEGYQTIATGDTSHAEGYQTLASGTYSHAEGDKSIASGVGSHAEGGLTLASGVYSHTEGRDTKATGDYSHAEGAETSGTTSYSHAEGFQTLANGVGSHAEGTATKATGDYSHAEGDRSIAIGVNSHAEGYQTVASGIISHAEGRNTNAYGEASHAEGYSTDATGEASHSEGQFTTASGRFSHSEGYGTNATGEASHAEGYDTTASAPNGAHAEGRNSVAQGQGSHAEGFVTNAIANYSHSQNYFTNAEGSSSHAGGVSSTASGVASFIHSTNSLVSGDRSVVLGGQNITGTADDTVYVPKLETVVDGEGIIMSSPNGTRYKITVDNAGNLITTAL